MEQIQQRSQGCCLMVVWKRCRDGVLPIHWPLLSCIIPTLFAYFFACHPFICLHFYFLVYWGLWGLVVVRLSGCRTSVAEHWLHKPGVPDLILGDCRPLHFFYFHLKNIQSLFIPTWGKSSKHECVYFLHKHDSTVSDKISKQNKLM